MRQSSVLARLVLGCSMISRFASIRAVLRLQCAACGAQLQDLVRIASGGVPRPPPIPDSSFPMYSLVSRDPRHMEAQLGTAQLHPGFPGRSRDRHAMTHKDALVRVLQPSG